jgi:estrogen-related receptor beta like 1
MVSESNQTFLDRVPYRRGSKSSFCKASNDKEQMMTRPIDQSSDGSTAVNEWEGEVQRAIPQLLVHFSKMDWRKQLKSLEKEMNTFTTEVEYSTHWFHNWNKETDEFVSLLTHVETELEDKYKGQVQRLRTCHEDLEKLKVDEKESMSRIATLSRKLNQVSLELEKAKRAVEEKGRSITDTSVLVQRKSDLQRLKADVRDYDVQIGLLGHFCLQKRVYDAKRKLELVPDDSFY